MHILRVCRGEERKQHSGEAQTPQSTTHPAHSEVTQVTLLS